MTPRRHIAVSIVAWALMLGALWLVVWHCAEPSWAESPYSPGDTLTVKMTPRDSLGVATSPDSVRLFVYRYGAVVDSSETFPGDIASFPGSPHTLYFNYVIPQTWGNPYALDFIAMGTGDGLFDEWITVPGNVRVNATVDSVRALAYASLVDSARAVATVALTDSARIVATVKDAWNVGHADSVGVALNVDLVDLVTNVSHVSDVDTVLHVADVDSVLYVADLDSARVVNRAWDVRGGHVDTLDLALVAAQITEDLTPDSIRAVGRAWDVRGGHLDSLDLALVADELTEEVTATVDSVDWVGRVALVDTTTFAFRADSVTVLDELIAIDELSDAAIDSIVAGVLAGTAGAGSAEVDTCAAGGTLGVYLQDTPVDLAKVWLHSEETLRLTGSGRNVLGETWAVNGYWRLHYYPEGDYPDTIYVSAWTGGVWPLRGQQVIVADNSEVCD